MTGYVHATAVLIGIDGVLIRGPSGSGKSLLARDLIAHTRARSMFAILVGDDRIGLSARGGRLIATPHPDIAGLIEVHYRGVVETQFRPSALIRLVVDFVPQADLDRMPEETEFHTEIMGLTLPCQKLPAGRRIAPDLISTALYGPDPQR